MQYFTATLLSIAQNVKVRFKKTCFKTVSIQFCSLW